MIEKNECMEYTVIWEKLGSLNEMLKSLGWILTWSSQIDGQRCFYQLPK